MTANSNAPVRADARHNRELIIASAREVFALRGEQTNMCDIARQAGVGKGTLYRNFPDRKALLIEVIRARLEEFCEIARRAEEVADPFEALAAALRTTLAAIQDDAGLHFAMMHAGDLHHESIQEQKAAIAATYTRILKRAQAAGAVRSDLDFDDIQMILAGIVSTMYFKASDADWQRHLQLTLAGLRPEHCVPTSPKRRNACL